MIIVEEVLFVGTAFAAFYTITLFLPRHASKRTFYAQIFAALHRFLRSDACTES
jgi:hypothetical protein